MKKCLLFTIAVILLNCIPLSGADTLYYTAKTMKKPALAIGLSAVLPGAGQVYNNKYVKSAVIFSAQSALAGTAAYFYYSYFTFREQYGESATVTKEALTYAKQVTWFSAAVYVYNLIDAYVDAHLSNFPDERLILEPDPKMNGVRLSYKF
jgi:O-antigen/teichoic acid export membrane protein